MQVLNVVGPPAGLSIRKQRQCGPLSRLHAISCPPLQDNDSETRASKRNVTSPAAIVVRELIQDDV